MICKLNGGKIYLSSVKLNGGERVKILILPMPDLLVKVKKYVIV
jgi:hypothetical protein